MSVQLDALSGLGDVVNRYIGAKACMGVHDNDEWRVLVTAATEQQVIATLNEARIARGALNAAKVNERDATIYFIQAALDDGWSWGEMAEELGAHPPALKRFYESNYREVSRNGRP